MYPAPTMVTLETVGALCGVCGALLVALHLPQLGYPFFLVSSALLLFVAVGQRNKNLIALQLAFLVCNLIGIFNVR